MKTSDLRNGPFVHRPLSSPNRLILPFIPYTCCHSGPGFLGKTSLPSQLKELGIDESNWNIHIKILQEEIEPKSPILFFQAIFSWISVYGLFCCLWYSQGKYHMKIRKWLEEFNEKVLGTQGLYAKFQTNETCGGLNSWLAISLNIDDSRSLREEPVVWRPKCCCGDDIVPNCQHIFLCLGPKRYI